MRILYLASDQQVPGRTGGSVHVLEVARGLAARGHEVHAVTWKAPGLAAREEREGVQWHRIRWAPPHRFFRFRARGAVGRIADQVRPDAIIERYYNFGGEGIRAATERGLPSLLEVNSPILDHPGSLKALLDAAMLVRPLRRYRESLCRQAAALVSPLPAIVPEFARAKTVTVTWGANVDAFRPQLRGPRARAEFGIPEKAVAVLFCGSFRPWHGVHVLEAAARQLVRREDIFFVLAGGPAAGPARGYRGRLLGSVPYERMPELVATADISVAPYDTARLAQLKLGFYWSPFKIFEAMASGVATVTIPRFPLTEILHEGEDGLFFTEGDATSLASVITRLADAPGLRERLGQSARRKVVAHYSWARHCAALEDVLQRIAR